MRRAGGYGNRGLIKTIDWSLVICWLVLVLIGWANIYASVHASEPASIFDFSSRSGKQFVWMITALIIAVSILFIIPPRFYEGFSIPIYAMVIGLLVAVIFLGITLGQIQLQLCGLNRDALQPRACRRHFKVIAMRHVASTHVINAHVAE